MTKSLFLATLLAAGTASATPTLYPTDINLLSYLANQTDSGLVADDSDIHKVYVLPPNVGTTTVLGLHTISANVGFCGEISDLQNYSRSTVQQIKELTDKKIQYQSEADKLFDKIQKARVEAAQIAADRNLQAIVDLDSSIDSMSSRLSELYKTAENCDTTCREINTEIRNVEIEKNNTQRNRRKLAQQNAEDVRAYDRKKAVVDALVQSNREVFQTLNQMKQDLVSIHAEYLSMYSTFGKMEGGRAAFKYESNWEANISTLRRNNPNFQFEKITTQNAKIFSNITSVKDIPGDLAVIAYELPGVQKDKYLQLDSGFPGSINSNLVLSLLGACPMLHPESFEIDANNGPQNMTYGMTITYDFPATMKLQASAKYNMYKMYQKIVSSGSSGGFFSSRSWTNVEEHSFFKDSFKVSWEEQDPENTISEEKRLEIEHEMRKAIMERIANLALPSAPDRNAIIAASAPPTHGAIVIANSLMSSCPGNGYCVAGSLILSCFDSIFGSGSATASYLQTQDFEATETWSSSKVIMKPWVTSYTSK
jgi:hypothetical protein